MDNLLHLFTSQTAEPQGLQDQPPALDVEISSDDVLEPAGLVMSVFEGMVVVQGPENS